MIPIRDKVRSSRFPIMTLLLIAANTLVFLHELSLGPTQLNNLMLRLGVVPMRLKAATEGMPREGALFAVSIFTSMFLHGGWLHLISNMWFLWIFGDNVEDRLGQGRFLFFYLLCGVLAALAHAFFNLGSTMPTVGASGAIAGVLGAYLMLYPKARIVTIVPIIFFLYFVELSALVFLGVWFLIQLLSQVLETGLAGRGVQSVAWMAHVGGFIAGMVLVRLIPPRRGRGSVSQRWG
jgi:membrane associated rhomboid family serine protease